MPVDIDRLKRAMFKPDASEHRMLRSIESGAVGGELRPKNHGVIEITAFCNLARSIEENRSLQVLYLQSQPFLGDGELACVLELLKKTPRITGVNLGELSSVSADGWRSFIDGVKHTRLIDCYAQPVGGGPSYDECRRLKQEILENRRRINVVKGKHPSMWRTCDYRVSKRKRKQ